MDKISFCNDSDLSSLKTFIKTNWDENHFTKKASIYIFSKFID